MDTVKLQVTEREQTGNGPARRVRAEGRLPGVLYGKGIESKAVTVNLEELVGAIRQHGQNVILELQMGGGGKGGKGKKSAGHYAIVKELQRHPTKRSLLHVDLQEVDLAVEIEAPVPIEFVGTPAGVADGGIVDWEHREVMVRALPSAMPASIALDVADLLIGQHLCVDALTAPEGTEIVDDPGVIIVTLVPPRIEQVAAAEEEEEEVEPEVIGEVESEE